MRLDVFHHFPPGKRDRRWRRLVLDRLDQLGEIVTALSDAVDAALAREADEDAANAAALAAKDAVIADLQSQVADLGNQLVTATTAEAAAQADADAKAAELAATAADTQAQIDRINALDAAPAAAPPADQPPVETPPGG